MKDRYIFWALLIVVTLFGATLRFVGLPQRGLAFYDEGVLHQEAIFIRDLVWAFEQSIWLKLSDICKGTNLWVCPDQTRMLLNNTAGISPYDAKPLHWGIVALGITGFGNTDYVGPVCMALFGTATIPIAFLIGKTLSDDKTGLLAALLLASNPMHVSYSRSGLAEADSVFFFSLAIYLLIRGRSTISRNRTIWLMGAGFFGAAAAGANHRWLLLGYAVLLVLLSWYSLLQKRPFRGFLGESAIMTSAYASLLLAYEVPWYIFVLIFKRCGQVLPFETYFEQLTHLYSSQFVPIGLKISDFFVAIPILWILGGPFYILSLLLATAWILLARRARRQFAVMAIWFLIPLIWFSVYGLKLARYLSLTIPAGCLIIALALSSVPGFLRIPNKHSPSAKRTISFSISAIWLFLLISSSLLQGIKFFQQETGYPYAFRLLRETGAPKHFSTQYYLSLTYLGKENSRMIPVSLEELREGYYDGYRYFLVDLQVYFDGYNQWPERQQVLYEVMNSIEPRWNLGNTIGSTPQYILEHNLDWTESTSFLYTPEKYDLLTEIRIYDLQEYFALAPKLGDGFSANSLLPSLTIRLPSDQ